MRCSAGECELAVRAADTIRRDRARIPSVAEDLAPRLLPHVRDSLGSGLDCHRHLWGDGAAIVELYTVEARTRTPPGDPAWLASLTAALHSCARAAEAVALILAGRDGSLALPVLREAEEAWI